MEKRCEDCRRREKIILNYCCRPGSGFTCKEEREGKINIQGYECCGTEGKFFERKANYTY